MAKKKDNKADPFNLDSSIDDFKFDFEYEEPKVNKNRKPILKAAVGAGRGAKEAVLSAEFLKASMKGALPDGFGRGIDFGDSTYKSLKSLYDESAKEIKPALKAAKNAATRIIPEDSKLLPKKFKDLLKGWKDEENASQRQSDERVDEVASTLRDIFEAQSLHGQKQRAQEDSEKKLDDGVAEIRFQSLMAAAGAAATAVTRLDQYTTQVTHKYHQRSLELQYRQLFAIQDAHKFAVESAVRRDELLMAISKNTSLPDAVKITTGEARSQVFKNKLFESLASGLYGGRNRYIEKLASGARDKLLGHVKQFASGLTQGAQDAESMASMTAGMGDMIDPYEFGGEIAGSEGAKMLGARASRWANSKLKDSVLGKRINNKFGLSKKSGRIHDKLDNLPNTLNEFRKNPNYGWDGSMKGTIFGMLQGLMPSMAADTKAVRLTGKDMEKPYAFTRRTDRSINEIIPGYLSRILREVQITRTGNENTPLLKYDHDRSSFTSAKALRNSIGSQIVDKGRQEGLQRRTQELLGRIDPQNKLSPEVRKAILDKLLENSANTNLASERRLARHNAYDGAPDHIGKAAAEHMSEFFKTSSEEGLQKFKKQHNELASWIGDPRDFIQQQLDAGNQSELVRLGLYDPKTGEINAKKIRDMYMDFKDGRQTQQSGPRAYAGAFAFKDMASQLTPKETLRQKAANAANKAKDFGSNAYAKATDPNMHEKAKTMANQALGSVVNFAIDAKARISQSAHDVYVAGESHPRIRAILMKMGKYKNAITGKVVSTIGELKQPIIDDEGNTIVSQDEMAKLVVINAVDKVTTKVSDITQQVEDKYGDTGAYQAANAAKITTSAVLQSAKNAFMNEMNKGGVDASDLPSDVFVDGDPTPRLTAFKMKAGQYFSKIKNKIISKPSDIDGPVIDINGQTVIDEEEVSKLHVLNNVLGKFTPVNIAASALRWLGKTAWWIQTDWGPRRAAKNLKILGKVYSKLFKGALGVAKGLLGFGAKVAGISMPNQDLYSKVGRLAIVGKMMSAGNYFSEKTGKLISKISDIDGPVRDKYNQVVLTMDEYLEGVSTVEGRKVAFDKLKGDATAMGGRLSNMASRGFGAVSGLFKKSKDDPEALAEKKLKNLDPAKMRDKVKGSFDQIKKRYGLSRSEVEGMESRSLLSQIKDALVPKKARKNSFEDSAKSTNNSANGINALSDKNAQQKKAGASSLASMFGLDKIGDMLGKGKDLITGAGAIKDVASAGAKAVGTGASTLGKLAGWGKTLLGLGGAAQAVTSVAGAATGAASTAAAAGGGGLLATIGSGLLAAGTATVSFLASPAVIGAATLALAGYGAYKGYKYLTRGNLKALGKLRIVQYGFHPTDSDHYTNAIDLENHVSSGLVYRKDGQAYIDYKQVKMSKMMSYFGLDAQNEKDRELFQLWFKNRFEPVYLTHATALKAVDPDRELPSVDGLKPEAKKKFLDAVKFPEGPYGYTQLPYPANVKIKASTASDVKAAIDYVITEMKADYAKKGDVPLIPGAAAMTMITHEEYSRKAGTPRSDNTPANAAARSAVMATAALSAKANLGSPDAEPKNMTVGKSGTSDLDPQANTTIPSTAGNLKLAGGEIADGRGASSWLRLSAGVSLDGINSQFKNQFYGAVEEYGRITGRAVTVTDGLRSYEDQARLKRLNPDKAAAPGTSMHEFGLAMDVDQKALNEMDKLGLLRKYGLTRPVGGEPWHLEAIGIQGNLAAYKSDPNAAAEAVKAGIGKGGGGLGSINGTRLASRSVEMSKNIMNASVSPDMKVVQNDDKLTPPTAPTSGFGFSQRKAATSYASPGYVGSKEYGQIAQKTAAATLLMSKDSQRGAFDGEAKSAIPTSTPVALSKNDPSVSVPYPSGSGIGGLKETIQAASKLVGVDSNLMLNTIAVESDFNAGASAGTSSATGIAQFTSGTWNGMLKKYGKQYGFDENTSPSDPKASAIMAAQYYKDNIKTLSSKINRPVGITEAYFSHFLGPGGAIKFFNAMESNPNAVGASIMPDAAAANKSVFYDNGRPRTLSEIYQNVSNRLKAKAKAYGIADPGELAAGNQSVKPASYQQAGMGYTAGAADGRNANYLPAVTTPGNYGQASAPRTVRNPSIAASGFGFASAVPTPAQSSMNSPSNSNKVEDLMTKSVDIQTSIYGVLKDIFGVIANKPADNSPPEKKTYSPPTPAVDMNRPQYGA